MSLWLENAPQRRQSRWLESHPSPCFGTSSACTLASNDRPCTTASTPSPSMSGVRLGPPGFDDQLHGFLPPLRVRSATFTKPAPSRHPRPGRPGSLLNSYTLSRPLRPTESRPVLERIVLPLCCRHGQIPEH